jgi:hypothetical protein
MNTHEHKSGILPAKVSLFIPIQLGLHVNVINKLAILVIIAIAS